MKKKLKILGIFCHPDDEVLAGWPIFQRDDVEKHLLILCDDFARKGHCRVQALLEVCKRENINLIGTMSEDNNFYSLPTRRADNILSDAIKRININIEASIDELQPDYIFTHNPVGEYGHGSHRLTFELVSQHPKVKDVIFTDICEISNHRSNNTIPRTIIDAYYHSGFTINENEQVLDMAFYERCFNTYQKRRAWTWNKNPIQNCDLYIIRGCNG